MTVEQIVTLRQNMPVVIETAHGVIELHRTFRDGNDLRDGRKLRLVLPDGLVPKFGMERVKSRPTWLEFDGDTQKPKHQTLTSVPTKGGFELRHVDAPAIRGRLRAVAK